MSSFWPETYGLFELGDGKGKENFEESIEKNILWLILCFVIFFLVSSQTEHGKITSHSFLFFSLGSNKPLVYLNSLLIMLHITTESLGIQASLCNGSKQAMSWIFREVLSYQDLFNSYGSSMFSLSCRVSFLFPYIDLVTTLTSHQCFMFCLILICCLQRRQRMILPLTPDGVRRQRKPKRNLLTPAKYKGSSALRAPWFVGMSFPLLWGYLPWVLVCNETPSLAVPFA